MIKDIVLSSILSAFLVSILLALLSLEYAGKNAWVLGIFAFPIAFAWSAFLSYPLIRLRQRAELSEHVQFLIYLVLGVSVGTLTAAAVFGARTTILGQESLVFVATYGGLGAACALSSWCYLRKHAA